MSLRLPFDLKHPWELIAPGEGAFVSGYLKPGSWVAARPVEAMATKAHDVKSVDFIFESRPFVILYYEKH
jgi:hypothetical protein